MSKFSLCPLCLFPGKKILNDDYYACPKCEAIFLDKKKRLSPEKEKARYENHNNDINNEGYRNFVFPITSAILREQTKDNIGLDFGSGTGPVISAVLKENNYNIQQYDPFFCDNKEALNIQYDYIACCEVIEHFKNPRKEFKKLKNLLKPTGTLYLMTKIFKDDIDFKNWHYRQDPTHVFIYRNKTFQYIFKKFKFKEFKIDKNLIVLRN